MITPSHIAPVLPQLLPFVAAAARPGSLLARPDAERLHLRVPTGARRPACGQHARGKWKIAAPNVDARHVCRRCIPKGRAAAWACSVLEEAPRAVAELIADAVVAAPTAERLQELQTVAVCASLTRQLVTGPVGYAWEPREQFLHELLAHRRRIFEHRRRRGIRDVHLPPMAEASS